MPCLPILMLSNTVKTSKWQHILCRTFKCLQLLREVIQIFTSCFCEGKVGILELRHNSLIVYESWIASCPSAAITMTLTDGVRTRSKTHVCGIARLRNSKYLRECPIGYNRICLAILIFS